MPIAYIYIYICLFHLSITSLLFCLALKFVLYNPPHYFCIMKVYIIGSRSIYFPILLSHPSVKLLIFVWYHWFTDLHAIWYNWFPMFYDFGNVYMTAMEFIFLCNITYSRDLLWSCRIRVSYLSGHYVSLSDDIVYLHICSLIIVLSNAYDINFFKIVVGMCMIESEINNKC